MPDPKYVIYGLIDPTTKLLRYIGLSANMYNRYYSHVAPSMLVDNTHKNNWIKSLIKRNLKPIMEIIEVCDSEEVLPEREAYWIAFHKQFGADLTNGTAVGIGSKYWLGKTRSQQTKDKISQAKRGKVGPWKDKKRSNETKQKIADSLRGKSCPWNKKPKSEETKRKISEAKKKK